MPIVNQRCFPLMRVFTAKEMTSDWRRRAHRPLISPSQIVSPGCKRSIIVLVSRPVTKVIHTKKLPPGYRSRRIDPTARHGLKWIRRYELTYVETLEKFAKMSPAEGRNEDHVTFNHGVYVSRLRINTHLIALVRFLRRMAYRLMPFMRVSTRQDASPVVAR